MKRKAEFNEGPLAFDRFRDAMKKIVSVPKAAVTQEERRAVLPAKRKKRRNR